MSGGAARLRSRHEAAPPCSLRYPWGARTEAPMMRLMIVIALGLSSSGMTGPQESRDLQSAKELERLKTGYADVLALQGTSRDEVFAIARLLRAKPDMAIDQIAASGEYCLKSGLGTMTHYASDPTKTREDIVYEFDATALTKAGLDLRNLPVLPALGHMEPGQWYYLPEGQVDPHHKHVMPGPTLLIAVDVR